ncbi:hypothetical protein PILCRDRAFT_89357 [Piloderma croceum F 1598]|uniref:Uncharacterized protein n=1 Tax=Piloderma croceum (strain F 1598) TaxID=765440 RepID=A0A0C3FPK6_PILCF|nr:hypothetical protein PILCRDRAFT_89357 [Piloderma croceum F 1598]
MSRSPRLTVEEIVAMQIHYTKVCEEQSEAFRMDPEECRRAYERYAQTEDVAKAGQSWMPQDIDRSAYIREMEARCKITPTSIYDRVKIYFAAHGIIACVINIDSRSQADQLRILARCNETLASGNEVHPVPGPIPNLLTRLTPTPSNREVTDKRLEGFQKDPSALLGKQFILGKEDGGDEGDSDGLLYEIIEVRLAKGGGKVFHVQFEGHSDCVDVVSEEMAGMLKRSTFVEISDDGTVMQET